ncbi:MAG: alpha/beta hydrolase-fold protein [Terracidiphilus sp.]
MHRILRLLAACLCFTWGMAPLLLCAAPKAKESRKHPPQETGFLNRRIQIGTTWYRYQVYVPEDWHRDEQKPWPVILFLHGRGERGAEGMWQTQIGLPEAIRDHPERWPFIVVMPQCSIDRYWTDKDMLAMAMAELDEETAEFHGDPARTYLMGLSMGGYGSWELARQHPTRWAAIAIAAGGIFWSYAPERWLQASTLPGEYAQAVGRTPIWLFHGAEDKIVAPRQDELLYTALKTAGGHVRLWVYQGLKHDCWTRAFDEPELPRWLLLHPRETQEPQPFAERISIPLHPPALKLTPTQLDSFAGEYVDKRGLVVVTLFRQGDLLYQKNHYGEIAELAAESTSVLFYPNGSSLTRIDVERDSQGRVTGLLLRDDRHEERWERIRAPLRTHSQD